MWVSGMGEVVFLTGPVRSGKSRRAVEIATGWGDDVVFVAAYRANPDDAEMVERVRRHRAERPAAWHTLEAPDDLAASLAALAHPVSGVLLDSIVLWAADRFGQDDDAILQEWSALLDALCAGPWPVVIVGDEIGWSPVPVEASLRRFRDLVGWLGQRTAAAATEAWLMVAGCPVRLK
jgi:adenosyl cobinamide kinase/adenosyl cobinamide phosphate guanylyltransferase